MEFRNFDAMLVAPLGDYPAGTYVSELIWPEPGTWENFQINVWVSAATGLTPSWVSVLESSSNGGTTWTTVPGSATPVISAAGSRISNAQVPPNSLVRVKTTVTSVGGVVTGRAFVGVTPVML